MLEISAAQEKHFRTLAFVWMLFSAWAVVLQVFLQKRLVAITSWAHVPGWQREIGLWNVGAVALIALTLASSQPVAPILLPVLLIWSGLFGINHLVAYFRTRSAHGHLSGFFMNLLPFLWAGAILIFVRH